MYNSSCYKGSKFCGTAKTPLGFLSILRMSFPIPQVRHFPKPACKGKYSLPVKVERSWRQAVSDEIFLTLRCERISSENLSPFKPVLGAADGQRK